MLGTHYRWRLVSDCEIEAGAIALNPPMHVTVTVELVPLTDLLASCAGSLTGAFLVAVAKSECMAYV